MHGQRNIKKTSMELVFRLVSFSFLAFYLVR